MLAPVSPKQAYRTDLKDRELVSSDTWRKDRGAGPDATICISSDRKRLVNHTAKAIMTAVAGAPIEDDSPIAVKYKQHSEREWGAMYPHIVRLYLGEQCILDEVMQIMETQYNFNTTGTKGISARCRSARTFSKLDAV